MGVGQKEGDHAKCLHEFKERQGDSGGGGEMRILGLS